MYEIKLSTRFKRDMKLAKKRGCNPKLIADVIKRLADGEALEENIMTIIWAEIMWGIVSVI